MPVLPCINAFACAAACALVQVWPTMGLWGCGAVGLWGCGAVGLWGCGGVGLWGCGDCGGVGTVGVWGCGGVGCGTLRLCVPPSAPMSLRLCSVYTLEPANMKWLLQLKAPQLTARVLYPGSGLPAFTTPSPLKDRPADMSGEEALGYLTTRLEEMTEEFHSTPMGRQLAPAPTKKFTQDEQEEANERLYSNMLVCLYRVWLYRVCLCCGCLRTGNGSSAVVARVIALLSPIPFARECAARMLSPDGHCKTFDAPATG